MTNENSFSLTCERLGTGDGSVNVLAKNDYKVFKRIFAFAFKPLEDYLGIDCFSIITNYTAISKRENVYNKAVSQAVRDISKKIEQADDENDIFKIITGFYKEYGTGIFGINKAFRIKNENGAVKFVACLLYTSLNKHRKHLKCFKWFLVP